MGSLKIEGYELRSGLYYDSLCDMWVEVTDGVAKVGYDPLGLEINGTLAQLGIAKVGTSVIRGETVGSLEAEKFVGPIVSPLSGMLVEVNEAVVGDVSLMHRDPYGAWVFAIAISDPSELDELVTGDALGESFAGRLAAYRLKGVLAR